MRYRGWVDFNTFTTMELEYQPRNTYREIELGLAPFFFLHALLLLSNRQAMCQAL